MSIPTNNCRPKSRRRLVVALFAPTVILLAGSTVLADSGQEPIAPPWVDTRTGEVDADKIPERVPVAGPSGELVGYIDKDELLPPLPPRPPASAQEPLELVRFDEEGRRVVERVELNADGEIVPAAPSPG